MADRGMAGRHESGPGIRSRHRAVERRAHPRREVVATATVFTDDGCVGPLVVENLSAGGAILAGHAGPPVGASVRVLLQLPGRALIGMGARVVRTSDDGREPSFALAFSKLSAAVEDTIQDAVVSALDSSSGPDEHAPGAPPPEASASGEG